MANIIHVHLKGQHRDYYFSKISAIYSVLTKEEVGITYESLYHAIKSRNGMVTTKKAIIKQSEFVGHQRAKVIHVHLMGKSKDYYFNKISAIFSILTPDEVGMTYSTLTHAGRLSGNGTVFTKTAIIKKAALISPKRNNEKK